MPDISIAELREETLDRLDNLVAGQSISEAMRQKLQGKTRVTRGMNVALDLFVKQAQSDIVAGLVEIVSLAADTTVGDDGVKAGVKTWLWPVRAFFDRQDGGVLSMILDEKEYPAHPSEIVPINTIRMMGRNPFYADDCASAFNIDPTAARIYTTRNVTAKARIISEPYLMTDANEYDNGEASLPSTIPVDMSYLNDIAQMAVYQLLQVGTSIQSEPVAEETNEE